MSLPLAVILACLLSGLAAIIGVGLQALRHRARPLRGWLQLPIGALLTFAFIPAAIGHAEGVWGLRHPLLWACIVAGSVGLILQTLGWAAVLRRPLRPGHCPRCEYDLRGLDHCPECGPAKDD